jgi:2-dehydropantoate 2-reductase
MRHAVLGAGGVGGLVGGALARTGADVVLVLRPETLARHPARLRIASAALGDFEVRVGTTAVLDRDVDVLWVTPKATQLEAAVERAPPSRVSDAVVVPLLNGIDHVVLLRARYEHVLAATIAVESERVEPGLVRQPTPFASVVVAPARSRTRSRTSCARPASTSRSDPTSQLCSGRSLRSSRRSR